MLSSKINLHWFETKGYLTQFTVLKEYKKKLKELSEKVIRESMNAKKQGKRAALYFLDSQARDSGQFFLLLLNSFFN